MYCIQTSATEDGDCVRDRNKKEQLQGTFSVRVAVSCGALLPGRTVDLGTLTGN
jgi:hypothetical protein